MRWHWPGYAAFLLAGALAVAGCGGASSGWEADWNDVATPHDLISRTQVIVIGRLLSEQETTFGVPSPVDGKIGSTLTETVRVIGVEESLKGDVAPGTEITTVWTRASSRVALGTSGPLAFEVVAMSPGELYVLFLSRGERQPYHPAVIPDAFYGLTATPGIARVDEVGQLTFVASARYTREGRERGSIPEGDQVPAAFRVDLASLRLAIARNDRDPSVVEPAPPLGTPDATKQALIDASAKD